VTFYSVTLERTLWLPDDGPRTEICRSVFNVLMCKFYKFYICAVVGIIIECILALYMCTQPQICRWFVFQLCWNECCSFVHLVVHEKSLVS